MGRERRRKAYELKRRSGYQDNNYGEHARRPPSELRGMIRGGGWDSEGCSSMKIRSFGSWKPFIGIKPLKRLYDDRGSFTEVIRRDWSDVFS